MAAIKLVSERLSTDIEDVEMNPANPDMMVDLWEKCSLQGNIFKNFLVGLNTINKIIIIK